jgi:hypothetical protein
MELYEVLKTGTILTFSGYISSAFESVHEVAGLPICLPPVINTAIL